MLSSGKFLHRSVQLCHSDVHLQYKSNEKNDSVSRYDCYETEDGPQHGVAQPEPHWRAEAAPFQPLVAYK